MDPVLRWIVRGRHPDSGSLQPLIRSVFLPSGYLEAAQSEAEISHLLVHEPHVDIEDNRGNVRVGRCGQVAGGRVEALGKPKLLAVFTLYVSFTHSALHAVRQRLVQRSRDTLGHDLNRIASEASKLLDGLGVPIGVHC